METLAHKIRVRLGCEKGHALPFSADERLNRLEVASPLYAQLLIRNPEIALWLEEPTNKEASFRYSALKSIWTHEFPNDDLTEEALFDKLRCFRRQISLRIAYREVNELCSLEESMNEHSLLADFCIQTVANTLHQKFEKRFGIPWLESGNRACPYVILALGKLGGMELNFCSDVDLIYLYENDGTCIKEGKKTALTNQEYYQRFFQELTTTLQKKTPEGFLFNVDLRLRPEGGNSPIAKTIPFSENYYWSRGQTWERMALIKARPCCGNAPLGEELLETLNAYRYPRLIPPGLIEEVTLLKKRTEHEALGKQKRLTDIKSGWGGIREIEYITQTLQLLNGGKNPFIQSRQTLEGLKSLNRYAFLPKDDVQALQRAYIFLRSVENALQMREEKQTHTLPKSDEAKKDLATLFKKKDYLELLETLNEYRTHVNTLYQKLLPQGNDKNEHKEWRALLSSNTLPKSITSICQKHSLNPELLADALRTFFLGKNHHQVTEEQVRLAVSLSKSFSSTFPLLASPITSLERLAKLAEKYGARTAFIQTCAATPKLFKTLCILLDRSIFIAEALAQYPEILEELLNARATQIKTERQIRKEIESLPQDNEFPHFLWLYVKAEQIRTAMCQALEEWNLDQVQTHLSTLAQATLCHSLKRAQLEGDTALIALGKLGGEELTYGSDLDLLILSTNAPSNNAQILNFKKTIEHKELSHSTYSIDLRLRPYGNDGSLTSTLNSLQEYYKSHAQPWEIQALTRARYIGGNQDLGDNFKALKKSLLYSNAPPQDTLDSIWEMRKKIQSNKTNPQNPTLDFKTAEGGLLDNEFLAQTTQLTLGHQYPEFQEQNTLKVLEAAQKLNFFPETEITQNLHCFQRLLQIELALRLDTQTPVTQIPKNAQAQERLALWIGLPAGSNFATYYTQTLSENKESTQKLIKALKS